MNNSQSVDLRDLLPVLLAFGFLAVIGMVGVLLA